MILEITLENFPQQKDLSFQIEVTTHCLAKLMQKRHIIVTFENFGDKEKTLKPTKKENSSDVSKTKNQYCII